MTQFLIFNPTRFVVDETIRSSTLRNPVKFEILVIKFDFTRVTEEDLFIPVLTRDKCLDDLGVICNVIWVLLNFRSCSVSRLSSSRTSITKSSASVVPPAVASTTAPTSSGSSEGSTLSDSPSSASAVLPHDSSPPSSLSIASVNCSSQVRKGRRRIKV